MGEVKTNFSILSLGLDLQLHFECTYCEVHVSMILQAMPVETLMSLVGPHVRKSRQVVRCKLDHRPRHNTSGSFLTNVEKTPTFIVPRPCIWTELNNTLFIKNFINTLSRTLLTESVLFRLINILTDKDQMLVFYLLSFIFVCRCLLPTSAPFLHPFINFHNFFGFAVAL